MKMLLIILSCLIVVSCTHTEKASEAILKCDGFKDTIVYKLLLEDKFVYEGHTDVNVLLPGRCHLESTGIYTKIEVDD